MIRRLTSAAAVATTLCIALIPASAFAAKPDPLQVDIYSKSFSSFSGSGVMESFNFLQKLAKKVDVTLHYKNKPGAKSATVEKERQQLCAEQIGKGNNWMKFAQCAAEGKPTKKCAGKAGVPPKKLDKCMAEEAAALYDTSIKSAASVAVKDAPVLYIGGKKYEGAMDEAAITLAVCDALPGATPGPCKKAMKNAGLIGAKVPVDVFIMSKCPFGVKFMEQMMEVKGLMDGRVTLKVDYVGKKEKKELLSLHGEEEVQGDILQLCAGKFGSTSEWMAFMKCQNENWRKIPKGWEACAEKAGLSMAKMSKCYEKAQGKNLLTASFKKTKAKKVAGSPTVFLNKKPFRHRTAIGISRALCDAMKAPKHPYCATLPEPENVEVTVVEDKRCTETFCVADKFIDFLKKGMPGAKFTKLDYSSPEGKALFKESGLTNLPIVVFSDNVKKEQEAWAKLKTRITPMKTGSELVYPLGNKWDPTAEICDDGVDNTGNRKVDCKDPTCKGKIICRTEKPGKVDLFVMSQCPYAARAVANLAEVFKTFGRDRSVIDLEFNYIGSERGGKLSSMHGEAEVEEDKRQLCAQKHYGDDYLFMEYMACRFSNLKSNDWESCAKGNIDSKVIRTCAEGKEGNQLLKKSFKATRDAEINGSPSWLINNRYDYRASTAADIKKAFCERNADATGCNAK